MREEEYDGSLLVTKFVKGNNPSTEVIAKQYILNESLRKIKRINSVLLYMDILSFHPDDYEKLLDDRILKRITRAYLRKRAPHAMATAVVHRKSKSMNTHIHIAISGINYSTAESIRMSRDAYKQVKLDAELFQRKHYPFLKKSEINHDKQHDKGKAIIKDVEFKMEQKRGVISSKKQILQVLAECYRSATSKQHFFTSLVQHNIELYNRGAYIVGLKVHGTKHRFIKLGYLPTSLELLNERNLSINKRLEELDTIKDRQKGLSKDWEQ